MADIILCAESAKHLFKRGIWEIDTYKYSPAMTGYIFADTPEVREVIKDIKLNPMFDRV